VDFILKLAFSLHFNKLIMPPDAKRLKLDCNDNEYSHLPLNRDLRRIFASYYLLNKLSSKLQYSYYSSITENSYLIGSTKITDVLRIYVSFNGLLVFRVF
jgi:hypothetical protein